MKKKHFYVIAYDIGDDKRRDKVVKVLEKVGNRVNFSVFECMLTDIQYNKVYSQLEKIAVKREDFINIYQLCTDCFGRTKYIPAQRPKSIPKIVVI